ncbi:MAG: 4Fe-4S dicluster domain-containing protein [Planctomycetes bacterium]|nr:4Fe-4S dicluster domain-containing protein [Planctomycetota bacterium]
MLKLRDEDRVRILSAVARKGPAYSVRRVVVVTVSLLVLLAVPLLDLARIDVWGGNHRLLGHPATIVQGLQGIVVALGVLYGTTFLTNTFLGRFFCGWGCPVGYVSRLGEDVDRKQKNRVQWALSHLAGAGFVATFVGAVMCWWVDPRVMIEGSLAARLWTGGIFAALWAGGFAHAFLWRFGFCLHVCPIGLYYRLVTSRPAVGIVFSEVPDPCIQCGACANVCPVDLEPRDLGKPMQPEAGADSLAVGDDDRYGDAECLRCGDCVEACRMVFLPRKGQTPPLRFGFHSKGGDSPLPIVKAVRGHRQTPAHAAAKVDADAADRSHERPLGDVAAVRPPSPDGPKDAAAVPERPATR